MPENAFVIDAHTHMTQPDFSVVLSHSGMRFNCFFERDRHTESLDSMAANSVRNKIVAYEAYYDHIIEQWHKRGNKGPRPRLRVPFVTDSMERAEHILLLARRLAHNPRRKMVYATTIDSFLNEADALRQPIFLDHDGTWQALVNIYPTSLFHREPVCFHQEIVEPSFAFC